MATVLDLNLVPTYNTLTIGFADISIYDKTPTNVSFEITAPGFNKVNLLFTPKAVNIYNASHFNIDCSATTPLPDGIYYIRYSVAPNPINYVEKSFMRVEQLLCKYYRTLLSLDTHCSCNKPMMDKNKSMLRSANVLIEGCIAATNQCDSDTAYQLYQKAEKILTNITVCDC